MRIQTFELCLVLAGLFVCTQASIERGFTEHFQNWLRENGYDEFGFHRPDLSGACYGGKSSDDEQLNYDPVIFIHGNSDVAVGYDYWQTGFTTSIEYFLSQGHSKGELYATTWGTGNDKDSSKAVHSREILEYLRAFVEAVLEYTGAEKVDIISHSMGVTLGRRVIKGGYVSADHFDLGDSLTHRVDAFVGIAGANYGLVSCYGPDEMLFDTCNNKNGFYPGIMKDVGLSDYLDELNRDGTKEGAYVASVLSTFDDIIGFEDIVYGRYTSQWPTEDESKIYTTPEYTHFHLRDETFDTQYNMVVYHSKRVTAESFLQ